MPMLRLIGRTQRGGVEDDTLPLTFECRQRSRQRVRLASGREAALMLPRGGGLLRDGDLLAADDGSLVRVLAAPEAVSTVRAAETLELVCAAYHLGNRHVPLQIGEGWLRYPHDPVLDAMVRGLGLNVTAEYAAFEPVPGAYSAGVHQAGLGHAHGHDHEH